MLCSLTLFLNQQGSTIILSSIILPFMRVVQVDLLPETATYNTGLYDRNRLTGLDPRTGKNFTVPGGPDNFGVQAAKPQPVECAIPPCLDAGRQPDSP